MIKKDKVGGSITARKKELIEKWIKPYSWGKVDENSGVVKTMASKYDLGVVTVAGLFNEHASKSTQKFAIGGEVGNTVSFKGDYGKLRKGVIKNKLNGGYTVVTDDGSVFVEPYEITEVTETPIELKKKRFGFFAVGGEIGNQVNFRGDYGKKKSGIITGKKNGGYIVSTDDGNVFVESYEIDGFEEAPVAKKKRFGFFEGGGDLGEEIIETYVQYKSVILERVGENIYLRANGKSWKLSKSQLNDLLEELEDYSNPLSASEYLMSVDKSKYENITSDKYEGGGEIQSKIDKLNKVVNSKMLPESAKAKARAEIERLEKELHESKETKSEEKAEHSDKIKMYISEFPRGLTEGVEDFIKEHKLSEDEVLKMLMGYKQGQILSTIASEAFSQRLSSEKKAKSVKEVLAFVKSDKAFKYKKPSYKLGDQWAKDFNYKGLLEYSLKVDENTPIKDLEKLHSSFEDNNYHTLGSPLWDAYIDLKQGNKDKARLNILKFRKGIEEELTDEFGWKKPTSDKIELRKITQEEWNTKKKHDYASIKDGQKYILTNENGATILVPVEIVKATTKAPAKQKFKIGDYVKILGSYGMTDYGKITAYTENSHFESHNGYQVTGFGDPLKENQIEKVTKAEYDKATAKKEEPKSTHDGFKVMSNQYLKQGKGATYHYVVNENGDTINKETKKVYRGQELTKYWFNTKEQAQKFANELNEKAPKTPKFKVGEVVLVNYGEERGKMGKITKAYSDEIPYYEIEGTSKEIPESNIELYKKPKPDHKKLLAKIKAKKTVTPSNAPSKGHKRNEASDKKRDALPLGKRVSKDGNIYWENRLNRGDISKEDKFEGGGEIGRNSSGWGLKFLNW